MITNTRQLQQLDLAHNMHPFMAFDKPRHMIAKGNGAYVFDTDGKQFLDGIAGLWCVNIGHGRQELADVMAQQAATLAYYSPFVIFSNPPATLLAKKLVDISPGNLRHVYFTLGGSEANDFTVRTIHQYNNLRKKPYKKHIISRLNAYHGMTYLAASISGIAYNNQGYDTITHFIHHITGPNVFRKPEKGMDDGQYLDWLVREFEQKIQMLGEQNVAAFIAEPIMGAGGVFVAPEGYHRRLWDICRNYDILYVSDEVVTAFCRLGEWFASETCYGIQPDIINTAKGITSGYSPLAATLISEEIFNTLAAGNFTTGYTYSGHPVSCATALKNIELLEQENIGACVKETATYLMAQLNRLKAEWQILGDVRGKGLMIGLEFVKDNSNMVDFDHPAQAKPGNRIAEKCFANGMIIRPLGDVINVLSPTLIWKRQHVDECIEILRRALKETTEELHREGHL